MLANRERQVSFQIYYITVLTLWSQLIPFLFTSLSRFFFNFKRQILNYGKNKEVIEPFFFLYALQLQEKYNITLGQSSVQIHRVLNSLTSHIQNFKLRKQQMGTKGHFNHASVCGFKCFISSCRTSKIEALYNKLHKIADS